jgi:hypothetical protein
MPNPLPTLAVALALLLAGAGCEYVHVRDPSGMEGTGIGFLTKPDFTAKRGADGTIDVTYKRDVATEAIKAATEGVAAGLVKATVKP